MGDSELMRNRNWWWLRRRIAGLASRPAPAPLLGYQDGQPVTVPIHPNRVQKALSEANG